MRLVNCASDSGSRRSRVGGRVFLRPIVRSFSQLPNLFPVFPGREEGDRKRRVGISVALHAARMWHKV